MRTGLEKSKKTMRVMRSTMICLGVCAGLTAAVAQTTGGTAAKPPLPGGPLLLKPEALSTWVITYAYPGEDKKAASATGAQRPAPVIPTQSAVSLARPRQITLTYTKPLWRAVVVNIDGRNEMEWSDGKVQIYEADGKSDPGLVPKDMSGRPLLPNYGRIGFPEMDWVSVATYTAVQSVGQHACLVFQKDDMTAWVDQDTRYPVKWQRGEEEIRGFTQLPPPTTPLVLPPEIARLSQAVQKDFERLARPIPKGG
jgi:hypothetical protein